MPTYQYRCRDCGEDLEVVQSFTDDALTECPNCGGSLRKVFNAPGISFKGSGFYKTDSRSSSGSKANGAKDKDKDKSESSSDTKADSKSESKSSDTTSADKKADTKKSDKKADA